MKVQFKKDIVIPKAHAVLPISVGQLYHEGDKFQATLAAIQKKLGSCDIVVADTLQRHNLSTHYPETESMHKALQYGDEWLARNMVYINEFSLPHAIIRWDECLQDPDFAAWHTRIKEFYMQNADYRNKIEDDINIFMQRSINRDSIPMRLNSLNYFLEETAVILSYFARQNYNYIIYPRPMPVSVKIAIEHFFSKKYPDLLKSVDFRFR